MQCPFYGKRIISSEVVRYGTQIVPGKFVCGGELFIPGGFAPGKMRNQCALNFRGVTPCPLETGGKRPDWERCDYSNPRVRGPIEHLAANAGLRFLRKKLKIASSG